MRRLELLIDTARELTQNTRYDADSGISQKLFVEYFNHASAALNRLVTNAKSKWFMKEVLVPVVQGQELYAWPKHIFLYNIDTMEWSDNRTDYITMYRGMVKDRFNTTVGYPYGYIPRNDGFLLAPTLNSGTLRLNYIKQPSRLEIRAGLISAVTINGSNQITALTISPTDPTFNPTYLNRDNFICVVDKFGKQTARHIVFNSVNVTTGVFSIDPFTLETGDTVAIGNYVVSGYDSTNLPEYPTTAEDFLKKHVEYECKYGDASKWSEEAKQDLIAIGQQILDSFGIMTDDVVQIPIINADYLWL